MQAHTLGEVGNLATVLLTVYSGTVLPIFIEIGLYLTDKEQKISWHSFLRHGVYTSLFTDNQPNQTGLFKEFYKLHSIGLAVSWGKDPEGFWSTAVVVAGNFVWRDLITETPKSIDAEGVEWVWGAVSPSPKTSSGAFRA